MVVRTKLYEQHLAANAKMVNFHGYEMPLHYGSQLDEHHAVRTNAGVFDVSHMAVVDVLGAGSRQFLRRLLTNDVDKITRVGQAIYSCMCNEHGGIIDDLIVYLRSPDSYRLVLNSACREQDLKWIHKKIQGFAAGVHEQHELAMLAVQGPKAIERTLNILTPEQADSVSTLTPFECAEIDSWFFARTGYTGENGLEIILPQTEISSLWEQLIAAGVQPCGLGARDTLRLEAGLMLHGQDMDDTTSPLESALSWTVSWEPEERDFIGMGYLLAQKHTGVKKKLVGLTLKDKGIMRTGQKVVIPGLTSGVITSGSYSPTLQKSIAFARIPNEAPREVMVEIRGKLYPAIVGSTRFLAK